MSGEPSGVTTAPRPGPTRSQLAIIGSSSLFAAALGMSSVAVPLLASARGYSIAQIGVYIALSALVQMGVRPALPGFMRGATEMGTVALGCALMAISTALFATSDGAAVFIISQVVMGVSRACFWTGGLTQVVRYGTESTKRTALFNASTGVGQLAGPALAGLLGTISLTTPVILAALFATAGLLATLGMDRHPSARRPATASSRGVWREPGVVLGSWAAFTAGSWRALLSSYVPVVLQGAGMGPLSVGLLLSGSSGAAVVGSAAAVPFTRRWSQLSILLMSTVVVGAGVALTGVGASSPWTVIPALLLSGFGAGTVQTVGPSLTAASLEHWRKGSGIAVAGFFRAVAMFGAPIAVAGALLIMPFSAASALLGGALAAPALVLRRLGSAVPADTTGKR